MNQGEPKTVKPYLVALLASTARAASATTATTSPEIAETATVAEVAETATAPEVAEQTATVAEGATGPVTPAPAGAPQLGTFGFDLAGMDRGVEPGDSFYDYANGTWDRSEEHTSELRSLMRISYAVFCLKKKKTEKKN